MLAAPERVVHAQATLSWGATGGGGTDTWDTSASNWFNGSAAVPWTQGSSAIFGGTAGTVALGPPITVHNMTFSTDGYTITGNTLTLSGSTPTITTNAGILATINSSISGSNGLVKSGIGTLTIGNGGTTGDLLGNVTDNGTLTFDRSSAKKTFPGVISGSLIKLGSDTLELTADNTYSGGTFITSGILVAGVPVAGQATSFALGRGDVNLLGGTLRPPSLDPLVINVGGNYTQGPGETLALGVE
jgi:fibronectin-binding autotransporter adhesin